MTPQEVTNRPSELRRAAQLAGLGVSDPEPDWARRPNVQFWLNFVGVVVLLVLALYVVPTALGFVNEQEAKVAGVGR